MGHGGAPVGSGGVPVGSGGARWNVTPYTGYAYGMQHKVSSKFLTKFLTFINMLSVRNRKASKKLAYPAMQEQRLSVIVRSGMDITMCIECGLAPFRMLL